MFFLIASDFGIYTPLLGSITISVGSYSSDDFFSGKIARARKINRTTTIPNSAKRAMWTV